MTTLEDDLATIAKARKDRLKRMWDVLADGYLGSANERAAAQKNFEHGYGLLGDPLAFADKVISEKLKPSGAV